MKVWWYDGVWRIGWDCNFCTISCNTKVHKADPHIVYATPVDYHDNIKPNCIFRTFWGLPHTYFVTVSPCEIPTSLSFYTIIHSAATSISIKVQTFKWLFDTQSSVLFYHLWHFTESNCLKPLTIGHVIPVEIMLHACGTYITFATPALPVDDYPRYDDCMEDNSEYYQNCSTGAVLWTTMLLNYMHTRTSS